MRVVQPPSIRASSGLRRHSAQPCSRSAKEAAFEASKFTTLPVGGDRERLTAANNRAMIDIRDKCAAFPTLRKAHRREAEVRGVKNNLGVSFHCEQEIPSQCCICVYAGPVSSVSNENFACETAVSQGFF